MAREYSAHQRKLIRNYYQNRDAIDAQRLTEIVTEIYLATTPKRTAQLWKRARDLLERTDGLDATLIDRICEKQDVETLAEIAEARFLSE